MHLTLESSIQQNCYWTVRELQFRNTTGYFPFSKNTFKLGKLSSHPLSLYNWTSLSKSSQSKEKKNSQKNPLKVNLRSKKYKALTTAPTALVKNSMTCGSWCLFLSYIFNYLFVQQVIITSTSAPPPPSFPPPINMTKRNMHTYTSCSLHNSWKLHGRHLSRGSHQELKNQRHY